MKVAIVQMDVLRGDPSANRASVAEVFPRAAADGTDVVVLPEMWNTGYSLERIGEIADSDGRPTISFISDMAARYSVNVVAGSIADARGGRVFNTSYVVDRRGRVVATYSKIHRFGLMDEDKYLAAGESPVTFDLDGTPCGIMICYDLRFPELARTLVLRGAGVLFVPAQWPNPRMNHWRILNLARAIENQAYVVSCNRVGRSGETTFFGHSMVVDPWGELVVEGSEDEQVLRCTVDPTRVEEVRKTIPVLADRRPKAYGL